MTSYLSRLVNRAAGTPAPRGLTPFIYPWTSVKNQERKGAFEASEELPNPETLPPPLTHQTHAEFPRQPVRAEHRFGEEPIKRVPSASPGMSVDHSLHIEPQARHDSSKMDEPGKAPGENIRKNRALPDHHTDAHVSSWANETIVTPYHVKTATETAAPNVPSYPVADKALRGEIQHPPGLPISRRSFHGVHNPAEPNEAGSTSNQEKKAGIIVEPSSELLPYAHAATRTEQVKTEQPKLYIGRLSVEVVPSEPIAGQPAPIRVQSQPGNAPSVHSIGHRTKLRFGLGQI